MSYAVKEIFLTLQGEGMQAGRRAVFLRFAGCNLWTGREQDRAERGLQLLRHRFRRHGWREWRPLRGRGPGRPGRRAMGRRATAGWSSSPAASRCSSSTALIDALHARGFEIAVETNGTLPAPDGIDWLCVSPKAGTEVVQRSGDELKLVWPQPGIDPAELAGWDFDHFLIQPMDCADAAGRARASRSPSSWPIRAGSSASRPTSCWDCPERRREPATRPARGLSRRRARIPLVAAGQQPCSRGSG